MSENFEKNENFEISKLYCNTEAVYNDIWAEDPACYLSDDEISIINLKTGLEKKAKAN